MPNWFFTAIGFQYTSKMFRAKLDKTGMTQSMSRVGCCIDNGPMEGFWGTLKSEMYYLRQFSDFDTLKKAIDDYITYYNTRRYRPSLVISTVYLTGSGSKQGGGCLTLTYYEIYSTSISICLFERQNSVEF